ncbi:hypothetical protein A7Q26_13750 [Sphingobium sp. TCM1]|uniref:Uncharacterized protein n=2 Tax=Sphingomonadaceae TaxID=41297 RepID=A0A6M4G7K2_SPHYA|nr:hypothetical protein [Sphingobium yanoikuyae]OAN58695.1 hypothetical protein A7Q26_13750 [Sphingobium sp. TCM1]QJR02233.1 hypothetical protein HH800_08535 [Sphingobium yanoikuyae]
MGYHPSDDETFMSPLRLGYSRSHSLAWKLQMLGEVEVALDLLQMEQLGGRTLKIVRHMSPPASIRDGASPNPGLA